MSAQAVELALGTVQFGLAYGIAGRGAPVPEGEIKDILALAWCAGVRTLDTASAYGDIESRLGALMRDQAFGVISKIPALPGAAAAAFVREAVTRIKTRLGASLRTVLFHRAEDLAGPDGEAAWNAACESLRDSGVELGASCYSPAEACALRERFALQVVQLPGNALDQRLRAVTLPPGVEIHLRSVFLQGLLLLPPSEAAARVPQAAQAIERWQRWCAERELTPLQAALGLAKALPGVRYCVVGVDRAAQLEDVLEAWRSSVSLHEPALSVDDGAIIDPRRW